MKIHGTSVTFVIDPEVHRPGTQDFSTSLPALMFFGVVDGNGAES